MVIVALLIIAPNWQELKCYSTGKPIYKWCIHPMEYYSTRKRDMLLMIVRTWKIFNLTRTRSERLLTVWGNRHMEKHWPSLILREIEIKITRRYHLTAVRMAIIKSKSLKITYGGKDVDKRKPLYIIGRNVNLYTHLGTQRGSFLKTLKIELPCDPAIPRLAIHQKKMNTNLKRYMNPKVYYSLVYNRKDMEATREQDAHGSCPHSTCLQYEISKHLNTTVLLRNTGSYMFVEVETFSQHMV